MLDRVHPDRAFPDGGGALDRLQVRDVRVNSRLVRLVFALEFDPMIDRGRLQLERNFFAGVQRSAAESGRFRQGMLKLGSHRALTNKELARWPAIGSSDDERGLQPTRTGKNTCLLSGGETLPTSSLTEVQSWRVAFLSFRAKSRNLSLLKAMIRDVSTSLDMTKKGQNTDLEVCVLAEVDGVISIQMRRSRTPSF